jgi:hypothetical protein
MAEQRESAGRGLGRRKRVHRPTRLQRRDEQPEPQETPTAEEEQRAAADAAHPPAAGPGAEPPAEEAGPGASAERGAEEQEAEPAPDDEQQEQEPVAERQEQQQQRERGHDGGTRRTAGVARIARVARTQLQELIGRPVTAVLGVERRDGDWEVEVETVELQRIPETTSIMGLYHVIVADDGEIQEFHRVRRYHRTRPDEDR